MAGVSASSSSSSSSRRLPWDELSAVVPLTAVGPADAILGCVPQQKAEPQTVEQMAAVLKWANGHGAALAVRGNGTKLEWGNVPRGLDLLVSMAAIKEVVEHAWDDLTATVQAGCTVAQFQHVLAQRGQRLAIDPLFPEKATIGGILSANDSGSLRTRFGALRDLLLGITAVLPDGTIARSGGRVVKNVAGYDLPKLFTGALGTLGVIAQATFRLHPLPAASRTLSFECDSTTKANASLLALQDSTLVPTGLQLRAARDTATFLDLRFEGIPASIAAQAERALHLVQGRQVGNESGEDVWRHGETFWTGSSQGCICRASTLPSKIADLCAATDRLAVERGTEWRALIQAVGLGWLCLEGDAPRLTTAIGRLRAQLGGAGGSLAVLRCPDEVRRRIDVWDSAGDAQPLMERLKWQFDPNGILNPGRFVGGI